MFCPKCGVQIIEATKFCKSCGLALGPMTDLVAGVGASPLGGSGLTNALSDFSSGQKVWLATLALIFSPVLLLAVPFLVPIAIVRMILQYNLQKRRLAAPATVQPGNIQQPQIQPAPSNLPYESRPPVPQTGLFITEAAPGSVIEDDTLRLRSQ
ncbi:MAG TPA: zinc ribbon domain-containing protein [Blastocatellia bacterium]|jgi:hypothetical protein